jgi:hypothetical protein
MRVKTTVKAGALNPNHNKAVVRAPGLKVKTSIKAGKKILFTGSHTPGANGVTN